MAKQEKTSTNAPRALLGTFVHDVPEDIFPLYYGLCCCGFLCGLEGGCGGREGRGSSLYLGGRSEEEKREKSDHDWRRGGEAFVRKRLLTMAVIFLARRKRGGKERSVVCVGGGEGEK